MTDRPRLLDLYCCEGGAGTGYARAGFEVVGVDIADQKLYPFEFHKADAIEYALAHGREFDVIHASPPCQRYSTITAEATRDDWPDLIGPTREALQQIGRPYVIENVAGARELLIDPMLLCGSSFGLGVRRHRYFESTEWLMSLPCDHASQPEPIGVYGHSGGQSLRPNGRSLHHHVARDKEHGREVMGMPWASWRGLVEAIPPAYTEFIGEQLIAILREAA